MALLLGCSHAGNEFDNASDRSDQPNIEYVATSGELGILCEQISEDGAYKKTTVCWPTEIYYGDTVYIASFYENLPDEPIVSFSVPYSRSIEDSFRGRVAITSPDVADEYLLRIPHRPWTPNYDRLASSASRSRPQFDDVEKRLDSQICIECPPLRGMDDPFWQTIERNMTSDGIVVRLTIVDSFRHRRDNPSTVKTTMTQDILIKPRPDEESELLKKWLAKTNEVLPSSETDINALLFFSSRSEVDLAARSDADIQICGKKYNPWLFIRYGNRKPSFPCNPTTLEGWRELESNLAPSTMRDEVRLTRLQLEFFAAKEGEASEKAALELFDWLKSLPEPQQAVMIRSIIENVSENVLDDAELNAKRRVLVKALWERLGRNSFLQ